MDILVLSRNQIYKRNWGRELFKLDLSKDHNVTYYGQGYSKTPPLKNITEILKEVPKPDIIFTYIMTYSKTFEGYELIKDIPKVHYEVDYFPPQLGKTNGGNIDYQNPFFFKSKYNLIFAPTKSMVCDMQTNKIAPKIFWLPFSVCVDKYKKLGLEKTIDIMATFTMKPHWYPDREILHQVINSLGVKTFTENVIHDEYIKKINESKIFVTNNGIFKCLNMKFTEVLACGTLLFADRPEDLDDLGLKDGEHLIIYNGWKNLKSKIRYYLSHESEREQIAENGMKFVRENHSNDVRIKEMTDIIQKELL